MCFFSFSAMKLLRPLLLFNNLFLLFLFMQPLWHFFEMQVLFNYDKISVGTVTECPPGFGWDKFVALFNTVSSMLHLFNTHS